MKGAVARSGNRLYVGTYDRYLYALSAQTGKLIWRTRSQDRLGGRGQFYSTPAVAYGRVYIGATDGKVYSFGATSGKLRWSQGTGGFVYSLAGGLAQDRLRGLLLRPLLRSSTRPPATSAGASSAGADISGSPTVLNGIVYFATLDERTYALDARTGKLLWSYNDGKYTPVVADVERLYLVGHARLWDGRAVRYVVTGAAGFIGSHLAEALLARVTTSSGSTRSPTTTTRREGGERRAVSTC